MRVLERLPSARYDDLALPDVILGIYDWVIAWDHRLGTAWVISTGIPVNGPDRERRAAERLEMVRERLGRPPARPAGPDRGRAGQADPRPAAAPTYPVLGVENAEEIALRSTFTHRGYLDAVARVRDYIIAGDIFQANLSQRFQARPPSPFSICMGSSGAGIRRPLPPTSTSQKWRC